MEIFYCNECRKRVSSVDVDQGRGIRAEGKIYCQDCAKRMGIAPSIADAAAAASKRKGSSARRIPRAGSSLTAPRTGQGPGPAEARSNTAGIVFMLALIAVLLVVVVMIMVTRTETPSPAPAPRPEPTVTETPTPAPTPAPAPAPREWDEPGPVIKHTPLPGTMPAVPVELIALPVSVPAEGWVNLISGGSLAESGWQHTLNKPDQGEVFELRDGALHKPITGKKGLLHRETDFTEGELSFDFVMEGGYFSVFVMDKSKDGRYYEMALGKKAQGAHNLRLIVKGNKIQALLDHKPIPSNACDLESELTAPMKTGAYIRFYVVAATALTVSNLRYAQAGAAAQNAPGWIGLLEGDSLAAAGWEHQIKNDQFETGFTLEQGMLKVGRKSGYVRVISPIMNMNEGEIEFTMENQGHCAEFRVLDSAEVTNQASMGWNGKLNGRHACRITIKGKDVTFTIDGQPVPGLAGTYAETKLRRLFSKGVQVRFDVIPNTALKITDLKYKPTR